MRAICQPCPLHRGGRSPRRPPREDQYYDPLHHRRTFLKGATAMAAGIAAAGRLARSAFAQTYPEREIRWIVYQLPGGLIDGTTRAIQPYLHEQGFNTVIDYVRGPSGRIARTELYRSEPDGYTIMTEAGPEEVLGEIVYGADYRVDEFQPIFGWFLNSFNIYVPKGRTSARSRTWSRRRARARSPSARSGAANPATCSWPCCAAPSISTFLGLWIGAIPGLGPVMAMAILFPFTFAMEPLTGLQRPLSAAIFVTCIVLLFGPPVSSYLRQSVSRLRGGGVNKMEKSQR